MPILLPGIHPACAPACLPPAADGELYVCGSNDSRQLGVRGAAGEALAPTLALLDGGGVAAWGGAEYGQLGLGACGTQVELPRVVKELRSMHVVRLAAGGSHSLALSATGGVFSCGNGSFGALGRGTTEGGCGSACLGVCRTLALALKPLCSLLVLLPCPAAGNDMPRPISRLWPLGVVQVACGENHSAALTADGRVFTWGRGDCWPCLLSCMHRGAALLPCPA